MVDEVCCSKTEGIIERKNHGMTSPNPQAVQQIVVSRSLSFLPWNKKRTIDQDSRQLHSLLTQIKFSQLQFMLNLSHRIVKERRFYYSAWRITSQIELFGHRAQVVQYFLKPIFSYQQYTRMVPLGAPHQCLCCAIY